ncbi:WG repeat-containing protein [Vacuolonema iberomarrocanum]|uniref:WG repeat-containing protein n=1 Tax=Vacuolonema iberomarrocanum TaxID=3454632 RepID=UPI0019E9C319|nr:WG repeat-containing protein [filamentous cyanobacterium LEGE 07170]
MRKFVGWLVIGLVLAFVASYTLLTPVFQKDSRSESDTSSLGAQELKPRGSQTIETLSSVKFDVLNSTEIDSISLPCFDESQVGVINTDGNLVIPHCFKVLGKFSEGVALVSFDADDGQTYRGFINTRGQFIFPPNLRREQRVALADHVGGFTDNLYQFVEGRFPLRQEPDGPIGFIDQTGEFVIEPQYESIGGFHEGVSVVCQYLVTEVRRGCGYINPDGEVLMPLDLQLATSFHEGIAVVRHPSLEGLFSAINKNFQRLTAEDRLDRVGGYDSYYGLISELSTGSGLAPVRIPGCVHPPVQLLPEANPAAPVDENAPEWTGPPYEQGTWGYLDVTNGGFAIEPLFCDFRQSPIAATGFIDDRALVRIHPNDTRASIPERWRGHLAMIDPQGNIIDNYGDAALPDYRVGAGWERGFQEGLLPVANAPRNSDEPSRFGYVDREGHWVIPPQFESVNYFQDGLALVQDPETERHGFIDKSGSYVIPPTFFRRTNDFGYREGFSQGLAAMPDESGRWGYINRQGERVIAPQFAEAEPFWSQGYAQVTLEDETINLIDRDGALIFNQPVDEFVITFTLKISDEFIFIALEKGSEDQRERIGLLMDA